MRKIIIFFISTLLFSDVRDIVKIISVLDENNLSVKISSYNIFCNETLNKSNKQKHIRKTKLLIKAILNNKVYINNKWYKKGDKINNYLIIKVKDKYIIFKQGDKIFRLNLHKKMF